MAHVLYELTDFKRLFLEYSGITTDIDVYFEYIDGLKNPIIVVNEEDYEAAAATMSTFNVEAKLKIAELKLK
jgi:hypothetical protein